MRHMILVVCAMTHRSRDFIERHYVELKQQNPKFPILIRECSGIEPRIYGRYGETGHVILH